MKRDLLKAVREYCIECCCNQPGEVRICPSVECPLYAYRMGRDPNAKKRKEKASN